MKQSRLGSEAEHSDACVVDTAKQNLAPVDFVHILLVSLRPHKYPMNIDGSAFFSSQSLPLLGNTKRSASGQCDLAPASHRAKTCPEKTCD